MNEWELLYQRLSRTGDKDMCGIEADFFMKLYHDFPEPRQPWITAFLTISTWFGTSRRSGVWTFYEAGDRKGMEMTVSYLRENWEQAMSDIFESGIHDYQDAADAQNCDYPAEWLAEADEIDDWIARHEDHLWKWEKDILMMNRASTLNR